MPYPFGLAITLKEFIERVALEYNTECQEIDGTLSGPHGEETIKVLIRRESNGKKRIAVIPNLKMEEYLMPDVLRSLCQQLNIPPQNFGLYLG